MGAETQAVAVARTTELMLFLMVGNGINPHDVNGLFRQNPLTVQTNAVIAQCFGE